MELVYTYGRMGAWTSSHSFHYESACQFRYEYSELTAHILELEASLRKEYRDVAEEHLEGLVFSETQHLHQRAYRLATAARLFVCMAIEGFINAYGTRRLGEAYYKRNLERLGVTEKLSVILLVCGLARKDSDDPTLKAIRRLFDRRNAIVHPKSKEILDLASVEKYEHPSSLPVTEAFQTLEVFVQEMCGLDEDIHRELEFRIPDDGEA